MNGSVSNNGFEIITYILNNIKVKKILLKIKIKYLLPKNKIISKMMKIDINIINKNWNIKEFIHLQTKKI